MTCRPRNALLIATALVFGLAVSDALAQRLERGAILVASPSLSDTSFFETVVLVLDHSDEDGSVGVIINRPTSLAPLQVFADSGISDYTGTVFYGGPVTPTRALLLFREPAAGDEGLVPIFDGVYLSGRFEPLAAMDATGRSQSRTRIYAGHARWGPGQLAAEVSAGAWILMRADAAIVFGDSPLALWRDLQAATGPREIAQAR